MAVIEITYDIQVDSGERFFSNPPTGQKLSESGRTLTSNSQVSGQRGGAKDSLVAT